MVLFVMTSLKGYMPALARHLNTSVAALYERQRVLVRKRVLSPDETKLSGPGGGVRATSASVAHLLVAVLATDSLSETETRAPLVSEAKLVAGGESPFKLVPKFVDAITVVLNSEALSRHVSEISVCRTEGRAAIRFKRKYQPAEFIFDAGPKSGLKSTHLLKRTSSS